MIDNARDHRKFKIGGGYALAAAGLLAAGYLFFGPSGVPTQRSEPGSPQTAATMAYGDPTCVLAARTFHDWGMPERTAGVTEAPDCTDIYRELDQIEGIQGVVNPGYVTGFPHPDGQPLSHLKIEFPKFMDAWNSDFDTDFHIALYHLSSR